MKHSVIHTFIVESDNDYNMLMKSQVEFAKLSDDRMLLENPTKEQVDILIAEGILNKEDVPMTRRYGKFQVSMSLIKDNPEEVSKIFEGLVITRAEHLLHKGAIEYFAWSSHFREVAIGEEIPEYMAECTKHEDGGLDVRWVDIAMKTEKEINAPAPSAMRTSKTIIVNGVEVKTKANTLTYDDIVKIAELPFRADYTMTWSTKVGKGIIYYGGQPAQVTEGMIFNVILTGDA